LQIKSKRIGVGEMLLTKPRQKISKSLFADKNNKNWSERDAPYHFFFSIRRKKKEKEKGSLKGIGPFGRDGLWNLDLERVVRKSM
jgi:hypothetical protein